MSGLKPKATKIKLGNKEYGLRCTLNAIDDIQDHLDIGISELTKQFENERTHLKVLRYLLTLFINEDLQVRKDDGETVELVIEKYVGRYIDAKNMSEATNLVLSAFNGSLPEVEEGEEIPNAQSE